MKAVKLGLLGLGTVGCGTVNVLARNHQEISRRAGHDIQIVAAAVHSLDKRRDLTVPLKLTTDALSIVNDPDIDIIVEVMGGTGVARELVLQAIENGKHIVTANKALIALHGNEIFSAAQRRGVMVAFEAAVAGGIPIIKAIREGLAGNRIEWLAGIINGTSNFILSEMFQHGHEFADVLAKAQALGYAEADPTFDIEGVDIAHKLTILASIAFGIPLNFTQVYKEGITHISAKDMIYAEQLGYRIKPLGIAERTAQGVHLRVHPALVPERSVLSHVNGAMNAVVVQADAVGQTLYCGAGAGAEPTASAVVADIVDVVRSLTVAPANRVPYLAFQDTALNDLPIQPMSELKTAYYLRMQVLNHAGVLAEITRILGDLDISIESFLQKENAAVNGYVSVVVVTYTVLENNMNQALTRLKALPDVHEDIVRIRLAPLGN